MAIAGQLLTETRWQQLADLGRVHRLHHWLEETTGCHEIEIVDDASLSLAELQAGNRRLGELWLWFVNEFAHTPRTWRAYRELLGR